MTTQLDIDDVTADHPKALEELETLRREAERYRWLRSKFKMDRGMLSIEMRFGISSPEELDKLLDYAVGKERVVRRIAKQK